MEAHLEKDRIETKKKVEKYQAIIKEAKTTLKEIDEDAVLSEVSINIFNDKTSADLKNDLELLKMKERQMIKETGVKFYVEPHKKSEKNRKTKQIIRSFNIEADSYIANVTAKNIDPQRKKIVAAFKRVNNLFKDDYVQLSQAFLELKLEKLTLIYNYQIQIEREREILKAKKEEIREQQREEHELVKARKKADKEERQFTREMNRLLEYLSKADTDIEKEMFAERIKELEKQIDELKATKKDIERRELNTRAGFVYIISNIGSLGENIYKIGMTRRLEPYDRIRELSSASVPFKFDVHAMIFSEDAPALEDTLHKHFKEHEVNKVNTRKEFFDVDLEKIKKVVHEKFDNTVKFIDEPEASEYWETQKIIENAVTTK